MILENLYHALSWKDAEGAVWYKPLSDIHFKGTQGWVVGSKQILQSMDGGLRWANRIPEEISRSASMPERVFKTNEHSVWVLLLAPHAANNCYYSTNAGRDWSVKRVSDMDHPRDIFFVDESTGWIISDDGKTPAGDAQIHLTQDGGDSWETYPLEIKGNARRLRFITRRKGLLIQHTTNENLTRTICNLLISSDGGHTWRLLKSFNRWITDLCMVSESDFFVVGEGGFISRTADGGLSWSRAYTKTRDCFNTIEVNSYGRGVAGGDFGLLMVTEDFGRHWTRYTPDEEVDNVVGVSFIRDDHLLLATTTGVFSLSL